MRITTSTPTRADAGTWTRDLFLTKEVLYRWATLACYLRVRRRRLFSSFSRTYEISIPANSVANIRTFLNIPKHAPRCGRFSHPIKLPHPITLPLYKYIMNARVRVGRGQAMRRMKHHPSNAGRMGRIGEEKTNLYRSASEPIWDCCLRVLPSTYCAKASRAQLSDIPLQSDTQALHLITRIPLILRREKRPSREGKSAFT